MDCIFCKIVNKEIPSKIVYEDKDYIAFDDINPKSKTHILIIPKNHIERFDKIDFTKDLKISCWLLKIAHKLIKEKQLYGCRLQINSWKDHGQEVFHMHLHLMSNLN